MGFLHDRLPLCDEQLAVFDHVMHEWLPSGSKWFEIAGVAGTGKTTLAAALARAIPDALLMAPTGRAASLLTQKTGLHATTIHSAIYHCDGDRKNPDTGRREPIFTPIPEGALAGSIALLDESSLVNDTIKGHISRTGLRVITFGDPAQLPPVTGEPGFVEPDVELRHIHRQALDSAIVRQAHVVREGGRYRDDSEEFEATSGAPTDEDYVDADVVLCFKNETRHAINRRIRALRGRRSRLPQPGEPLMCLRNNHNYGVYNGAVYELLEPYDPRERLMVLDVDGKRTEIPSAIFTEDDAPDLRRCSTGFDFGYSLTVHKAQGSEWNRVILIDEYPRWRDDYRRWCYTGITRAKRYCLAGGRP